MLRTGFWHSTNILCLRQEFFLLFYGEREAVYNILFLSCCYLQDLTAEGCYTVCSVLLTSWCLVSKEKHRFCQPAVLISLDCTTPHSRSTFMKLSEIPSSCLAPSWYWQFVLSAVSIPKSSPPHFIFSSAVKISCLSIKCGRGMLHSSFWCYLFLNSAF